MSAVTNLLKLNASHRLSGSPSAFHMPLRTVKMQQGTAKKM
jgi:hypothetical protein